MPRVFRQQYTRPIPEGAQRTTTKSKKGEEVAAVRFKGSDGRWITAPIVQKGKQTGTHCRVQSPTYYGWVKGKQLPLCSNKAAAEVMLADLVRKAENAQVGIGDPHEEHHKRPLTEHLADYRTELLSRDNAPRYVDLTISRLQALLAGCQFFFVPDFDPDRVTAWLTALRRNGPARHPLPVKKEEFTLAEVAEILGVKKFSVAPLIDRNGLVATGKGKARRYPRATVEALQGRKAGGVSIATANAYLIGLKSFVNWLVQSARTGANPFTRLELGNEATDRRHNRRELSALDLRKLLETTRASRRSFRGLDGEARFHLYALACGTGFRAGGLASLTPECFDLGGGFPTVTLPVRGDKSRKGKVQPLPLDVAELMRAYLVGRPAGKPIWPGTWARLRVGAQMLRKDLEATGIPYKVPGPDGPLFADFHALRHSYLTLGGRAGIDLRTLQELAGHSTPTLTARYSHRRRDDLAGAVEKLPSILPATPASTLTKQPPGATGTAGQPAIADTACLQSAYETLTKTSGGERWRTGEGEG